MTIILLYSTEFGRFRVRLYVKVTEDTPMLFASINVVQNYLVLATYDLQRYSQSLQRTTAITRGTPLVRSINLSMNQSINQSISQSINQSMNESINQSINQLVYLYGSSEAGLKHTYDYIL